MSDELKPEVAVEQTAPAVEATTVVADGTVEADSGTPTPTETPLEATSTAAPESAANPQSEPTAPKQPEYDLDAVHAELVAAKASKSTLQVTGLRRVRGGILVSYKNMPLFLPTSHLSLKANPSENELLALLQKTFDVHVHELDANDRTKVIVSRRRLLRVEHLNDFQVGQIVEGKVVSLTDFGAFVNLGGVDGMVHVSAMSRRRIGHPSELLQKGDTVKAVVKEINHNTQRLSLSMKELEADPWEQAASEFPVGSQHTGKIKSLTDFGAYIELKPGVEGLVHISEMSWARRIKHPSDLFAVGQEVPVQVLEILPEKHKIALGYKQTQPNPWDNIASRFQVGQIISGTVKEVFQRGAVITVADDIDAFMPRGKMHPSVRSKNNPFEVGQVIENILVMDVVPDSHSLILGMEGFDQSSQKSERSQRSERNNGEARPRGGSKREREEAPALETSAPVTLSDLLSEDEKRKLFGDETAS
jgi:small subunit ribosomal protein S1